MSYVESATLRVVDQSTGPIRKIRKELAALHKEARALKRSLNSSTSMFGTGASGAGAAKTSKAARETARAAAAMTTASAKMNRASIVQARVIKQTAKAAKDLAGLTGVKTGRANPVNGMRGAIAASRAAERAESLRVKETARIARQEKSIQRERDKAQARDLRQRAAAFARLDRDFAQTQRGPAPGRRGRAATPSSAETIMSTGGGSGGRRSGLGSVYSTFPGNVLPMASLYASYATIHGVKTVIVHATRAIMDRSEAETQDRIRGFSPQEIERNRNITRQTTALFPQLGQTEQRGAVRQLITLLGNNKDQGDLQAVATELARGQAAVSGIKGTENAQRFAEQSVKILDRLNLTNREDAINALKALTKGQLIGEKDLSFQQVLNNFRNAGTAVQGMSPDAMFNLVMAVDEAGLQAARNLRTFSEGMTRGTLQKEYLNRLNASGIGQGATLKDPELFQKNPYEWASQYLPAALKKVGYNVEGKDLNSAKELIKLRVALDKVGFLPTALNFPLLALQQQEARARQQEAGNKIDLAPVSRPWESIALTTQAIGQSFKDMAAELTPIADNLIAPQLFKIQTAFRDFAAYIRPSVDSIVQDGVKLRDVMPLIAGGTAVAVAGVAKWAMENPTQAAEAGGTAVFSASVLRFSAAVNQFSTAQAAGGPNGGNKGSVLATAGRVATIASIVYALFPNTERNTEGEIKVEGSTLGSFLGSVLPDAWSEGMRKSTEEWLNFTDKKNNEREALFKEYEDNRQPGLTDKIDAVTSEFWGSIGRRITDKIDSLINTQVVNGTWRDPKNPTNAPVNFNDWNFVAREGFVNSAEQFKATMDEGSALMRGEIKGGFAESVPALTAAGTQFGTNAGTSMSVWASEFGRVAGASFQNAVGALSIDLSSASNTPDVGTNINSVR